MRSLRSGYGPDRAAPTPASATAFEAWAGSAFRPIGDAYAHVVTVAGYPWTRALFWFGDDDLHLEASSIDRYFHLEQVFEHLWPPVFRLGRIMSPLDEAFDAPFRPHWPAPPAEASAFTRLVAPSRPPGADTLTDRLPGP